MIKIDIDTRCWQIPKEECFLGVESDDKVRILQFELSKNEFCNGLNFTDCNCFINYKNEDNDTIPYGITDMEIQEDGTVTFTWEVSRGAMIFKGNTFAVLCAKKVRDDGTITNEWNSRIGSFIVAKGLEPSSSITEVPEIDIISQLLLLAQQTNASAQTNINQSSQLLEKAEGLGYLKEEYDVLEARMNQFTSLQEGSTTGDAELIDGRIGYDGKIYDNIGGAIREQVSELKGDIADIVTVVDTNVISVTNDANGEKNGISYSLTKNGILTINGECTTNTSLDFSTVTNSIDYNGTVSVGMRYISGTLPPQLCLICYGLLDGQYSELFRVVGDDKGYVHSEKQITSSILAYSFTILAGSYDNVKIQLFVNKGGFTADKDGIYLNDYVNTGATENRIKSWTDKKYGRLLEKSVTVEKQVNIIKISDDFEDTQNGITIKYSKGVITLNGTATTRTSFTVAKSSTDITSGIAYVGYEIKSGSTSARVIISGNVDNTYKDILTGSSYQLFNTVYEKINCSSVYPFRLSVLENTVFDNYTISLFVNDAELLGANYETLDTSIRIDSQKDDILSSLMSSPYLESASHCIFKNVLQNVTDFSHVWLYGKKVSFMGDSFTDNNSSLYTDGRSYMYYQKDLLNLTAQNLGISGSTVSAISSASHPMVNRLSNIDSDADMVVFRGGVNDFYANVPLGNYESTDSNTFIGALNNSITYLKQNYPNSKLAFITPVFCSDAKSPNIANFTLEDYANAMVEVCRRHKVKCYDGYHFGICNEATSAIYLQDGLHYNSDGIEAEKLIITSFLTSI